MSTETVGEGLSSAQSSILSSGEFHQFVRTPETDAAMREFQEEMQLAENRRIREIMSNPWLAFVHKLLNTSTYKYYKSIQS